MAARKRRKIVDGGTAPSVAACACGERVLFHRSAVDGAEVRLVPEPVEDGAYILFNGRAFTDFNPTNVPKDQLRYDVHVCGASKEKRP